jgi:hypothetical protein
MQWRDAGALRLAALAGRSIERRQLLRHLLGFGRAGRELLDVAAALQIARLFEQPQMPGLQPGEVCRVAAASEPVEHGKRFAAGACADAAASRRGAPTNLRA